MRFYNKTLGAMLYTYMHANYMYINSGYFWNSKYLHFAPSLQNIRTIVFLEKVNNINNMVSEKTIKRRMTRQLIARQASRFFSNFLPFDQILKCNYFKDFF
jgi:hypothetical protein